jgi:hypothetical protein
MVTDDNIPEDANASVAENLPIPAWQQASDESNMPPNGQSDSVVRRLLIHATIFRGCEAVAMLLRFALPAMLVWAVVPFWRANANVPKTATTLAIGLAAILAAFALLMFLKLLRATLSLWGFCKSTYAFPIPQRSACVMQLVGIGLAVGTICLFIWVANWMNPQAQQFMPVEFYLPAAGMCLMFLLHAAAAVAGLRARSILDCIPIVPDISLIEEPDRSLLPGWLKRRTKQVGTTGDRDA